MNALYNLGIHFYRGAVKVAALRMPKARLMISGRRESRQRLRDAFAPNDRPVWVHASSLGEFEQGRPLIERLRRLHPERKILLTFFSPSGFEVRKNYAGVDCVAYLPFDTPARVAEFLSCVNPSMAIFVKYEFWGNILSSLHSRGIPTYLISAIFRPGQIFFRPWGEMFRKMLRCFDIIYVQDDNSRLLLSSIGIRNVVVAGDTRFDRVTDICRATVELPAVEIFRDSHPFTLVAGSSWQPDEDIYIPWVNDHPEVGVIIAPHEFDDQRLQRLASRIKGKTVFLSEAERNPELAKDAKALIVDSFGKLASIYRYADAACVGGGFGKSIHNINEAAVYDIPVLFGPNHGKFREATGLIDAGGGFEFKDTGGFAAVMNRFLNDKGQLSSAGEAAGAYIRSNLGATDIIYSQLFGE